MSTEGKLLGLRIVVTRPADQAESLCRLLEAQGASAVRLPLQAIEPVRQSATAARALQQAREASAWIFTSANAVAFARQLDAGVWPRAIAVGPATAAALARLDVAAIVPAVYSSEGVLALPELQDIAGRRFAIVTGEDGRDAIEAGLAERGARIERIEVYRRVALPLAPDVVAQALAGADGIVVTNGEALQQLVERTPDALRAQLLATQLVVPSRRVVELAAELGFETPPLVPEQIADAGYVRCLESWRAQHPTARPSSMTDDKNETVSAPTPTPNADAPSTPSDSPKPASAADAPSQPPPRSGGGWWWLLLVLVVVVAVAAAGWEGSRRVNAWFAAQDARIEALAADLNAAEAQADRLATGLSDQSVAVQRNAAEVARFADRLDAQDEAVGELREELGGGRARVQLALVEQLLMLANDRLRVGREVPAAIAALEAADARLATLKDPRLFEVREAIARARAALQAVPLPDETGTALALSSLIARAPRLALATHIPEHFEAKPQPAEPLPEDAGAWTRAWARVRRALASVFAVRRTDGPAPQLLSLEQSALIHQVLAMKLEGARLALLRRDGTSFRDLCASAVAWLDEYFRPGDPGVAATRQELLRLQTLQLEPPLPDISRSLVLLRAHLESPAQ